MKDSSRIVIFGAGSVGCYIGGRLLSAGADVKMIGRPRLQQLLEKHPLTITDYQGFEFQTSLKPGVYSTDPADARDADLVIVTTKSGGTDEAGRQLADVLQPGTPVISLQNGVNNADQLRKALPECLVLAGMIPFNVVQKAHGHFHHGTEGQLMAAGHPALEPFLYWFQRAGLALEERNDMTSVMWSKLLLNLNNPINALSGVPLLEELSQRDYRRCLALAQQETLTLMEMTGIPTTKLTSIPTQAIPYLMKSPNWFFSRFAKKMLTIDPIARSSMWEDLEAGRPTEVDWINGEVVRLAERLDLRAPINQALTNLIHQHEQGLRQPWPADELLKYLNQAQNDYHPVGG